MKILLVNKFLYPKGGDAISTINTGTLLSSKGHEVIFWGMEHPMNPDYPHKQYFISNVDFNNINSLHGRIKTAFSILYSLEAKNKISKLLDREKPDIVHLNNFAHQISPSILHAVKDRDIPMVMTMHDYKLTCPVYTMMSNGKICERCRHGRYYQCIIHRCSKRSYSKSFLNTMEMYLHHNVLHIYDLIDLFISPSEFLKMKSKEMGFQNEIVYLPNFVNITGMKPNFDCTKKEILYFGRLSSEKGIITLVDVVKNIRNISLRIIGSGPMREFLIEKIRKEKIENVLINNHVNDDELWEYVKRAMFTVVPSEWYEVFGLTIIESFALGKPVIGARIGAIPELIKDGKTGLTFDSGNSDDLREKIKYLIDNPDIIIEMGKNARDFVEKKFNNGKHYTELIKIYEKTIEINKNKKGTKK